MADRIVLTSEAKSELKKWWSEHNRGRPKSYSDLILEATSQLKLQRIAITKSFDKQGALEDAAAYASSQAESISKERDSAIQGLNEVKRELMSTQERLDKVVKVNTRLLELFIFSVGGTPPGENQ